MTSFGMVWKNNAESTPIDSKTLNGMIDDIRSRAQMYLDEMSKFLMLNFQYYQKYLLFNRNNKGSGAKITVVDKMNQPKNDNQPFNGFWDPPITH